MTTPRPIQRTLTESEAERYRSNLRKIQAERDQARMRKRRRQNRWTRWGERVRASALFLGIVFFFTWIYWLAIH